MDLCVAVGAGCRRRVGGGDELYRSVGGRNYWAIVSSGVFDVLKGDEVCGVLRKMVSGCA